MIATAIPQEYYLKDDVVALSRDLIGCRLYTNFGEGVTGGMIVETEAYRAPDDKASHAYQNKQTPRNKTMFLKGGIAYIYLCYGIHHLFNIVTNIASIPHAILVRAIEPEVGIAHMIKCRNKAGKDYSLTSGPGALSQALGLTKTHDGRALQGPEIWLEEKVVAISEKEIIASPRVGIDYAEEDALKPWRFRLKKSKWTSKPKN